MTVQVRRVAAVVLALFAALFVNLNVVQVLRADEYADNPRNVTRQLEREYGIRRGTILAADGTTELAVVAETGGTLRFGRTYPQGELYGHITGYYSFLFGRSELEESHNDVLTGSANVVGTLTDLTAGRAQEGDSIVATVQPAVQSAARDALGERAGAVVALDPRDGGLLALWSAPGYDPDELAAVGEGAGESVRAAWDRLNADEGRPLENRALRGYYAPGSTFKVVTAAAALAAGTPPDRTFPDPREQELPQTSATIGNFGDGLCNGGEPLTLAQALAVSCNTTFAALGVELGAGALVEQAEAFGFGTELGGALPPVQESFVPPPGELDAPATAQSAIGQRDVRVTPLQMAVVAAAIGNDGVLVAPQLVDRIEDFGGAVLDEPGPEELGAALDPADAEALTEMMVGVVERGSGTGAALQGARVAGKTGTAESGDPGGAPTVWFIGFAPADDPTVAVAVVIEDGGDVGSEATGGALAAPVARAVLAAALDQEAQ